MTTNQTESIFDPSKLENMEFNDSFGTVINPVPADEHVASISKYELRKSSSGKVVLDLTWLVDSDIARKATGMDKPSVRQSVFLTFNEKGGLDKDLNPQLGRLREAVGQNVAGQPWSFGMLIGQVARIRVAHRIVREDSTGEEITYADVKGVSKL